MNHADRKAFARVQRLEHEILAAQDSWMRRLQQWSEEAETLLLRSDIPDDDLRPLMESAARVAHRMRLIATWVVKHTPPKEIPRG